MIFNCAPARGATNRRKKMQQSSYISTHAPARGATRHFRNLNRHYSISTHAPARGATSPDNFNGGQDHNFNSRTREGCDLLPTRINRHFPDFNSRTREGCDPIPLLITGKAVNFNSRTREGCDSKKQTKTIAYKCLFPA